MPRPIVYMPWIEPMNFGERGTGSPEKSPKNCRIVAPVTGSTTGLVDHEVVVLGLEVRGLCAHAERFGDQRLELELDALRFTSAAL